MNDIYGAVDSMLEELELLPVGSGQAAPAAPAPVLPPCDWCLAEALANLHPENGVEVERASVRYAGKFSCAWHAAFYWAPDVDHALPAEEWLRLDFLWLLEHV